MNAIEDMRARLTEQFRSGRKPSGGFNIQSTKKPAFRPTANDMPRLPYSRMPNPKPSYDRVGRPNKTAEPTPPLYRKKPKNIFGGWL